MVFYDLCFNKYISHNKKNVIDIKIIPIIVCVYIKEISSSKKKKKLSKKLDNFFKRKYPRNYPNKRTSLDKTRYGFFWYYYAVIAIIMNSHNEATPHKKNEKN